MSVGALRELFASFGVEVDDAPLDRAHGKLEATKGAADRFGQALEDVALAFSATVVARGVASFVTRIQSTAAELASTAYQLGVTTDALQEWRNAAASSGSTAEVADAGLRSFANTIGAARLGSAEAADAFAAIGVSLVGVNGQARDASDLFEDAGLALSGIEDAATRGALATKLFGRQGRALLPIFAGGSAGLATMRRRFRELGGGISRDGIAQAKEFGDAVDEFKASIFGAESAIAQRLFPAAADLVRWLTDAAARMGDVVRQSSILEATLGVLGAAFVGLAVRSAVANLPILVFAAGLAATALIAEDLFTLFSGGKSIFGEFAEEVLGIDVANAVKSWNDAVEEFIGNIVGAYEWVSSLKGRVDSFFAGAVDSGVAVARDVGGRIASAGAPAASFAGEASAIVANTVGGSRDIGQIATIAPPVASAPRTAASVAPRVTTATVSSPITIDARGSDPREVARAVREEHTRMLRDAQAVLEQEGGD